MSFGMSAPAYWLSPSVLTMMSAPSFTQASMPAANADASPFRCGKRTMWSAPCRRATADVPSRDPSSITSTSTTSMPGIVRGMSPSVAGSVWASLRHGIWTISFFTGHRTRIRSQKQEARSKEPASAQP